MYQVVTGFYGSLCGLHGELKKREQGILALFGGLIFARFVSLRCLEQSGYGIFKFEPILGLIYRVRDN
jgi:hypothetical protein